MLFVILALNYTIFFLMPGDPVTLFVNPIKGSQEARALLIARLKAEWGLDLPPTERFLVYLKNMLTFSFGNSIISGAPVTQELGIRLGYTLELMGGSAILGIGIGVILGVLVAYKHGGKFDSFMVTASLITYSLPVFWMGLVFILIFSIGLGWFPTANAVPYDWALPGRWPVAYTVTSSAAPQWSGTMVFNFDPTAAWNLFYGYASHLFLPLLTLTLFTYGGYLLLTRAVMIEALTEDYVNTARAKGVPERNIIFRHALKNASLPLITSAALHFGFILSGAIITEGVFSWPGLGRWIFAAINQSDYHVLQAAFYIIALCVIIANIVADLLYGVVDPRIKYG
jgi:ABC-type dipeptide/oligopeptide/nickel transport system permease component